MERANLAPRRDGHTQGRPFLGPKRLGGPSMPEHGFQGPSPVDEPMPTDPGAMPTLHQPKAWLASCQYHSPGHSPPLICQVTVHGRPLEAVLDSGSTVTLASPTVLPVRHQVTGSLPVTCVHGDVRDVEATVLSIGGPAGEWPDCRCHEGASSTPASWPRLAWLQGGTRGGSESLKPASSKEPEGSVSQEASPKTSAPG